MCFESHASCGHCRGSEPGWGALRDGFVQGCWDAGSVTLKGNNGTKPLEKCACWTSEKESPGQVVGLFSVSSCDGCLCNLLRQVAWPMVAAAVLGGGGRLKTHVSATTSHSRDRGANQQVRAQEWAGPPRGSPSSYLPWPISFLFWAVGQRRGVGRKRRLCPSSVNPRICPRALYSQGLETIFKFSSKSPTCCTFCYPQWIAAGCNVSPHVGVMASRSEILTQTCNDINWRQFKTVRLNPLFLSEKYNFYIFGFPIPLCPHRSSLAKAPSGWGQFPTLGSVQLKVQVPNEVAFCSISSNMNQSRMLGVTN